MAPAAPGTAPDTTLVASPGLLLRLAARDPRAWQEIVIEDDTGLAETAGFLFRNLRWDFEEDLSRVTGDVLAHLIGELRCAASNAGASRPWSYGRVLSAPM